MGYRTRQRFFAASFRLRFDRRSASDRFAHPSALDCSSAHARAERSEATTRTIRSEQNASERTPAESLRRRVRRYPRLLSGARIHPSCETPLFCRDGSSRLRAVRNVRPGSLCGKRDYEPQSPHHSSAPEIFHPALRANSRTRRRTPSCPLRRKRLSFPSRIKTRHAFEPVLSLWGGFGLPQPRLNHRINAAKMSGRILGKDWYYCNLYWPEAKLAIEYESTLFHSSSENMQKDSRRRAALAQAGINVITVTSSQFNGIAELERIARIVAKATGIKRLSNRFRPNPRRIELHNALLGTDWPGSPR